MSDRLSTIEEQLKLGIEAARAGKRLKAQEFLTQILKVAPNNVSALFWLAFVSPAPQDSINLLEHILSLDPNNERAKAGIQWAQQRQAVAMPPTAAATVAPLSDQVEQSEDQAITSESLAPGENQPELANLSGEAPKMVKKEPVAHRARPIIDPFSAVILLLGVLALLTLSLGMVLTFGPSDTLAAWWSNTPTKSPAISPAEVIFVEPNPRDKPPARSLRASRNEPKNFASATDTLIMKLPELMGVEAPDLKKSAQPELVESQAVSIMAEPTAVPAVVSAAPADLIGPDLPLAENLLLAQNLLLAHQPAYPEEKWIEVNLNTQQITAWEGSTPVFTFIGSTGLPNTPTVLGEYNIYWKLESTVMAGPDYYLPEVPYTMYFYNGYALHGAYWHNNFGQPMSHGCVNLDPGDAQQLFEWADPIIPPGQTQVVASVDNPGTLVVVHQ